MQTLLDPAVLFFLLGVLAGAVRSDLAVPTAVSRGLSLYLLMALGLKGGFALAESGLSWDMARALLAAALMACIVPMLGYAVLRRRTSPFDAAGVAAAYGSVSAVTFVAASGFLEAKELPFSGHMVAIMALMESPAIIVGMVLLMNYDKEGTDRPTLGHMLRHSFTNASVLILIGSLLIGLVADAKQAEGIKPFTTDIFKGFLAIFLLEMGMVTAARFGAFRKYGGYVSAMAVVFPLVNGSLAAWLSGFITPVMGDRFMFAILAASASYIAVPAAMRLAAPKADPGLYIPMALGVTFPFNITVGMPLFFGIIQGTV